MAALGPGDTVAGSADALAFFATVNKALAASGKRELVIYVHGANNTVARASAQAAQLRHFTGRRAVMLSLLPVAIDGVDTAPLHRRRPRRGRVKRVNNCASGCGCCSDVPRFLGPVVSGKMALNPKGRADEEEPIH